MKSLIQRMLVSTAVAIVALAPAGHAMAASPHLKANLHHKASAPAAPAPYNYQAPLDVAAIPPYPNYSSYAAPAAASRAGTDIAARPAYPQWGGGYPVGPWGGSYPVAGIDVRGLIAALAGAGLPLHYGGKVAVSASGSYDYVDSPPPDTSAADAAGWAAEQEANDATAAAIQQNDANLQALDQSIAAAEEQNDEANAATQQYEINNGM